MDDAPASRDRADVEAWLAEREEESVRLVREALSRIVSEALDGVLGTLVASVTYDLSAIDGIPDAWLAFTHTWADNLMGTYLGGSMSAWLGARNPEVSDARWFESVTNENAVSYMDGATNRLKGIGDNVWTSVRARLQQSLTQGYTIDALREEVARTAQVAIGRAETIARTETMGAYINGDMGGMQALGAKGPVEKVWRATSDARTRPSHVEADGQCVPFAADFTVGDVSMSHPHAAGAPADEVVNCRCYVEFLYPGDARPDGTVVESADAPRPTAARVAAPPAQPERSVPQNAVRIGARHDSGLWHRETARSYAEGAQARVNLKGEDGEVRVRIGGDALRGVLDDGRFRTQHETGSSGGAFAPDLRLSHEDAMFGAHAEHPVYGFIDRSVFGAPDAEFPAVRMYGELEVKLKASVQERTTLTFGDSLITENPPLPIPLSEVASSSLDRVSEAWASTAYHPSELFERRGSAYVEAQIHGGLTPDDIASVSGPSMDLTRSLRATLDRLGIKWEITADEEW